MLPVAILAGGLATRLRPITESIPKALIGINGEPFLAHQLRLLGRNGFDRVVLCAGYRGDMIRDFAGDGSAFGLHLEYSFDGPELLGTGGAIRRALPTLGPRFAVLYGDSYLPCNYSVVERAFFSAGKPALMTVFHNEGRWESSNVEYSGDRIVAYSKTARTPAMRHVDYGLGFFDARVFAGYADGAFDLAQVYSDCLEGHDLAAFEVQDRFYEIGSREGIADLRRFLGGTSTEG